MPFPALEMYGQLAVALKVDHMADHILGHHLPVDQAADQQPPHPVMSALDGRYLSPCQSRQNPGPIYQK